MKKGAEFGDATPRCRPLILEEEEGERHPIGAFKIDHSNDFN